MSVEAELTVVIPTLGREVLRACLDALCAGDTLPASVIVVDQSPDRAVTGIVEEARAHGLAVRHVASDRTGRSAGVNRGIAEVTTRFLAVTDDDCLVARDWVRRMADRLRAQPGAIITGRVDAGEGVQLSTVTSMEPVVQKRPALRFDRLSGGNMGVAKDVMARVGPLEEHPCMRTAEDAEYAYRALRKGVLLIYAPDVAVRHLAWRDARQRLEQYDSYARSHGGFFGRYLRRGDAFIAVRAAVHLARALRRWIAGGLQRDAEIARHGRAYTLGLLPGIVAGWRSGGRA